MIIVFVPLLQYQAEKQVVVLEDQLTKAEENVRIQTELFYCYQSCSSSHGNKLRNYSMKRSLKKGKYHLLPSGAPAIWNTK